MKNHDQAGPRSAAGRRHALWLLAALLAAPPAAAFWDWSSALRTARNSASNFAFNKAAMRFRGGDWQWRASATAPKSPRLRIVGASVDAPARSGAYAGSAHTAQVEVIVEWQPLFRWITGGPYRLRGRATAAVLRDSRGNWMPLLVE